MGLADRAFQACLTELEKIGTGKSPKEEEPTLLKRLAVPALATGAGLAAYGAARKFRPSAIPELRALQEKAKNTAFEVATSAPKGRLFRSGLFGARDIPTRPAASDASQILKRPGATVLHHAPGSHPVQGDVNINAGALPGALDDKHTFHQLVTRGTGGAEGLPGSVPRTELLRDVIRQAKGDPSKLQSTFGSDFVIKPRTGSMSKAEDLVTAATDVRHPRMREALQNPGEFILQEKIPIQNEFRVHTVNNVPFTASHRQLPHEGLRGLWNKYMGGGGGAFVPVLGEERQRLMDFARNATKHIGDTSEGNLLGKAENLHHALDIARTPTGEFKLIESNPVPGTLMNPIISRKLQHQVTGRVPKDVAALMGLGAAGGTAVATHQALSSDPEKRATALEQYRLDACLQELEKIGQEKKDKQGITGTAFGHEEKVSAARAQLTVSKSREGRRPLSVGTLLRKEKEGTLWKHSEGSGNNTVSYAAGDPPGMTGSAAKYSRTADEVPSREDGRENVAVIPATGRSALAPAATNQPEERTNT